MILFLDFDGVLHGWSQPAFQQVPRIDALLRDHPDLEVVVTSSWRHSETLEQLAAHFAPELRPRFVGVTPNSRGAQSYTRYHEILDYLEANGQDEWYALDDCAAFFPPGCPRLLLCDAARGYDAATDKVLRRWLKRAGV
ncbi:HAD domain-containing protein [Paludibacterium yongneupense]|uniref:HAD domain-containing protein n=1 Tax=Paludibacterium yongneupense TaxID=400061 RepID=UPI00040FC329|nr:HAD domain-containing protein [Paludibacterium yongneupense]